MTGENELPTRSSSAYFPFFQTMCDMADVTSSVWQPFLKAVGRTHLEFASVQARQTRAFVHWSHQLARPTNPADFYNANAQLWASLMQGYLDAVPRVAAAVETAADAVGPKVLALQQPKQHRDTLILLERGEGTTYERKVA
jgi:hypothetical protein